MRTRTGRQLASIVVLAVVCAADRMASAEGDARQSARLDAIIDASYRAAYSLDHAEALRLARQAIAAAPGESRAHRTLASVLWLDILFRRGTVTVDDYLGGVERTQKSAPKPEPSLEAEFRQALQRTIALAEARLAANPGSADAQYDVGAAHALQASYTASVEGSLTAAFQSARRAFDAQEQVLEIDPGRTGAQLVVGTYRYLVSTFSLPGRLVAYIAGFGGGRDQGIAMIEGAARDPRLQVEAGTTLLLVYTRERRHADAMRVAQQLGARYPRNRLFTLEAAAAAIRAGRSREAVALVARGFAQFESDPRAKIPAERALWLYKRGLAQAGLGRLEAARTDLLAALDAGATGWTAGRIHLDLGRIATQAGRRPEAVSQYERARVLCEAHADQACSRAASRLRRQ
jgi:hypothetical protein